MTRSSHHVEHLEDRRLLTTVIGGDVFEYRQTNAGVEQVIRVKLEGNITAELIGAQVNRQDNSIQLVNLPGQLERDGQVTDIGGGLVAASAITDIGPISIPGVGSPNISAIAASGPNTFYAINTQANFVGIDPGTGLPTQGRATQIVQLTVPPGGVGTVFGTVIGTIFIPNNTTNTQLPLTVTAADTAPNGDLFFIGTIAYGSSALFSVRPSLANGATLNDEVAESLIFHGVTIGPGGGQAQTAPNIGSIVFTVDGLFGALNGGGAGATNSELIQISTTTGAIVARNPIRTGGAAAGAPVTNIVGLDVDAQGNLIAIQSGMNANVYSLQTNGLAFSLGGLGTGGATGLAFVPGITDPITGNTSGAFIGVDGGSELFFLNSADRNPAQTLWNVYVTSSDLTGKIVIGHVRDLTQVPFPDPYVIRPFDGSIGDVRTQNAQSGAPVFVGAPGGDWQGNHWCLNAGPLSQHNR